MLYFRSVDYLETVPPGQRWIYAEMGWAERQLIDLKKRLVLMGYDVKFFSSPKEWADLLAEDFKKSIEVDFPKAQYTDLAREILDHQSFGEVRKRCYVGGDKYFQQLDKVDALVFSCLIAPVLACVRPGVRTGTRMSVVVYLCLYALRARRSRCCWASHAFAEACLCSA